MAIESPPADDDMTSANDESSKGPDKEPDDPSKEPSEKQNSTHGNKKDLATTIR